MIRFCLLCLLAILISCSDDDHQVAPASGNKILEFSFLMKDNPLPVNVFGEIDSVSHEILVILPGNTLKTGLIPHIRTSQGATLQGYAHSDFIDPVSYTVTSGNGASQTYTVTVFSEMDALRAILRSNSSSSLGWNRFEPDPADWEGVTMENGVISELRLFNKGLTSIPPEIGYLRNLKSLLLHMNDFSSLPEEIGNLENLHSLTVGINDELSSVPSALGNLRSLEILYIDNAKLTSIPGEIGNLSRLRELYINGNDFTVIPAEVCALESTLGTRIIKDSGMICE